MGLIRNLLGRTFYPDNEWTRGKDGVPMRPYDMSTDTMDEFMGVRVDPIDEPVSGLRKLTGSVRKPGVVGSAAQTYVLDGRLNDSFKAVNELLEKGVTVRRVTSPAQGVRPGDFVVSGGAPADLAAAAKDTGVDFTPTSASLAGLHDVKRLRIGMYLRYSGGNIDEGWTRWLLEQFRFPASPLMDAEIKKGDLNAKYEVIIIPDDQAATILGERGAAGRAGAPAGGEGGGFPAQNYPPEYRSGIGTEGVTALKSFVEKGGILVAWVRLPTLPPTAWVSAFAMFSQIKARKNSGALAPPLK